METGKENTFIRQLGTMGLAAGAIGALLCTLGFFVDRERFFQSYLYGWFFWVAISVGCLGFLLLHHLVASGWGVSIQRILEAGASNFLLLAILFVPVIVGMDHLYPWTDHEAAAGDHHLEHKLPYLNKTFFIVRYGIYFALWIGISMILSKASPERSAHLKEVSPPRLRQFCGPAILLLVLSTTFAAVDWTMSLETDWFSPVHGLLFLVSSILGGLALSTALAIGIHSKNSNTDALPSDNLHDLGNFLMAFVLLWAYISFTQFLIIWYGNIPEDLRWVARRTGPGWQAVALALVVFHFAIPFLLLLNRSLKRNAKLLAYVAAGIVGMRLVDQYWNIAPAFHPDAISLHWMDAVAPLAVGGWWFFFFSRTLGKKPLLPVALTADQEAESHG